MPCMYLVAPMCDAAYNGDLEEVKNLVEKGADVNLGIPHDNRTPLHFAAGGGHLEVVTYLVSKGAILQPDRFGMLPVNEANPHPKIRQYLQDIALKDPNTLKRVSTGLPDNLMIQRNKVFELISKQGYFPYSLINQEVSYAYTGLGLHPKYFEHFGAAQIARHFHVLIAAKKVAQTTDKLTLSFELEDEKSAFFLTSLDDKKLSREMTVKVSDYLNKTPNLIHQDGTANTGYSLTFMASEGPAFPEDTMWWNQQNSGDSCKGKGGQVGLFICDRLIYDKVYPFRETDLELVANSQFLHARSVFALETYQRLLEKVVEQRTAVIEVLLGELYPGESAGYVVQFATSEILGRNYLVELNQCFRYCNCQPKRYYVHTFANGIVTYVCYFPTVSQESINRLADALRYVAHFKQTPGRSERIWNLVVTNRIEPSMSIYFMAIIKYAFSFFPKELYYRQYNELAEDLKAFPSLKFKLDEMYLQSVTDVITSERLYDILIRHLEICETMWDDFKEIAMGEKEPTENDSIAEVIQKMVPDKMERQVLFTFLRFNTSLLATNFFKPNMTPASIVFRFNPEIVLKGRSRSMFPELPYGIFLAMGRGFYGFHVRFREISRGGIRLIRSRDREAYEKNASTLFEENYNLAYTQHLKNKDIPESGSKGTILLDSDYATKGAQANMEPAFVKYIDGLLDIMMSDEVGLKTHLTKPEMLFFGPDENTADLMDIGALRAKQRGYPYWKSLTTGKSTQFGGVPHDVYGITTNSVHEYVLGLLEKLGIQEESITKFQTGGPDGDLGSNEIKISKDKTIGIVDGSGVLYDPNGLDRGELLRLADRRLTISHFSQTKISKDGFRYLCEDKDIELPDGSKWRSGVNLRDGFQFTRFAQADLFVPCGGRPASVTGANVHKLINKNMTQWKYVVEGANLFFTDDARKQLEKAGVHLFRDASANKGGVTSSSMEVFAALCMSDKEHDALLTVKRGETPPPFYASYVEDILSVVRSNARLEFEAIWRLSKQPEQSLCKFEITREISDRINRIHDSVMAQSISTNNPLLKIVLKKCVAPTLLTEISLDDIIARVPSAYLQAKICSWIASRFVYYKGGGEFEFYKFLTELEQAEHPIARL